MPTKHQGFTRQAVANTVWPYLEAAFEVVRGDFGTPEAFAEKALGIDAAARERLKADLLEGFAPGSVDLVVANLPYVGEEEWAGLARNVRDFEPRLALVSGCDGLTAISRLVSMAADVIVPSGGLMLEIGENQADAVKDLLCQTTRLKFQKLVFDYAGQARVMRAMRPA